MAHDASPDACLDRGATVPADLALDLVPGGPTTFGALRGRRIVLYFYPKDHTPGCTNESIDFTTHHPAFEALGATIIGASRDSASSHEKFRAKYDMPFALATDPDETLCNAFGVIKLKNMYGKQVRGIERSTFLIDGDGTIVESWRKVKVLGHVEAVLERLRAL